MKTRLVFAAVMLLVCSLAFASGINEKNVSFQNAQVETESIEKLEELYNSAVEVYKSQRSKLQEAMAEAYAKRDVDGYLEAKDLLASLVVPEVTKEQTEALVERIAEADEEEKAKIASFLLENSRFYRPTLTFSYSSSDANSSRSFQKTVVQAPGTTLTAPSLKSTGKFLGWGSEDGIVEYEAGSEITMPYSDTTLYAVFSHGITVKDSLNDTEVFVEGTEASLETPMVPEDSTAVFCGWYMDGEKVEDTAVVEDGQDGLVQAAWKDLTVDGFGIHTSRRGTEIVFSLRNTGNLSLSGLKVTLEGEGVTSTPEELTASRLGSGRSVRGSFMVSSEAEKGSQLALELVVEDEDGNIWRTPFNFTVY